MSDATPATPDAGPVADSPPVPPTATTEGLPEYEPLTPEMVEDEAVRGDFVMKWAVILLAVLFGCTVIVETATLVHVKTGQYLAGHGFLPPAKDVFSYTATELPWVNLAWAFDLICSVAFGAGSFIGLSAFKAILAGLALGLIAHTSRPGVSTWWGSICAALAVLACQPHFTAQPEIVTLLGIALCLWLVHRWMWTGTTHLLWMLIPVCIGWSNMDDHAWWGPYLLLLFGLGEVLNQSNSRSECSPPQRKTLWMAIGGCWAGLLVNPFLWHSWLAPIVQFGTYYPARQVVSPQRFEAQSLVRTLPWLNQPVVMAAAALLFLTAGVLLVINRRRIHFGHVLMFFGAAVPAILAAYELAAASVVFCVIATVNGQAWYAARGTPQYSTEPRALMFSRGGRAVTVLAIFALALLFTVGRLRPTGMGQVGLGLDTDLAGTIQSYETVLKDSLDDRPFNFTPEQGDLLIWLGQKPFLDQRVVLYTAPRDTSVLDQFLKLRVALSPKKQGAQQTPQDVRYWKQEFNKLKVTHCLPRLGGVIPDYKTFDDLSRSREWRLTRLGSATAAFYRFDVKEAPVKAYLAKNQFDFGDSIFKTEAELLSPRAGWPQLPTFYQRYIWQSSKRPSAEVREAAHLVKVASNVREAGMGLLYLAIRRAQEGLAKDQNDAAAYELLGRSYTQLLALEAAGNPDSDLARLRYLQAVQAFNLSLICAPDNYQVHEFLAQLYARFNRGDLVLREKTAVYDWWNAQNFTDPDLENAQILSLEQTGKDMDNINKMLSQVDAQAKKLPKEVLSNKYQHAMFYNQNGMPLKALDLLKPEDETTPQSPDEMSLRAELLIEAGRTEEAYDLAGQLEGYSQQVQIPNWQFQRVLTLLGNAEYTLAAQLWTRKAQEEERMAAANILRALVPRNYSVMGKPWPLTLTEPAIGYFYSTPQTTSNLNLMAALIYLEAGQIKRATEYFRLVLKQNPNHYDRALVAFYLEKLTGQWVDRYPPAERIPIEFAPEK